MANRVQDEKPAGSDEIKAWMKENIAEQDERYQAIVKEMEALNPDRQDWYARFLEICRTKGFNMNGDMRRAIPDEEIPERPDRPDADRVVW